MNLNELLDCNFGADGATVLQEMLEQGADIHATVGVDAETPLHVATRRRRKEAVEQLLDAGANINSKTAGGKTAYAHAARRGFSELVEVLERRGADTALNAPDRLAVALVDGNLDEARSILREHPDVARTGNPEEDRLLADVAGRNETEPVALLIAAGADLSARGLDDGTALHQAAWFGQPDNARQLIDAGAPLDIFDSVHASSPLGWAVHGSRYSGGAPQREDLYLELAKMLLDAGSILHYPDAPDSDAYFQRLMSDAAPLVAKLLQSTK